MTFDEWWWSEVESSPCPLCLASRLGMGDMKKAYNAGFKEACRRYNLREDPEDYRPSDVFDEYGHYGENNPPVGEMSNPDRKSVV